MNKASKGFSLVEMVVVIAIMGIVTSLSLSCLSMVRKATVNSAASDLDYQIGRTRSETLTKHRESIYLKMYTDGIAVKTCIVTVHNDGTETENFKVNLGSNVVVVATTDDGKSVTLSPSSSGEIRLAFDRRSGVVDSMTSGTSNLVSDDTKNITFDISLVTGTYKHRTVKLNVANGTVVS